MSRKTAFITFCHVPMADEVALTGHLNATELGCLHKIRNYLWMRNFQGLKNDDLAIAKICQITKNKWLKIKDIYNLIVRRCTKCRKVHTCV